MGSELCKTCVHTKVCMKDKNLVGDVFVMGHPMFFDNDKLYEKYKERERQGFPCKDYMPTAEPKKGKWIPCSERLPEGGMYFVTKRQANGVIQMAVGSYYAPTKEWSGNGNFKDVIAWMPLPDPYEEI